jgi:hypothetical protein
MAFDEEVNANVAQKILSVFIYADLMYQLNGTPHHEYIHREAKKHLGQARRLLVQVSSLGPEGAKVWVKHFIESMNDGTA